MSIYGAATFAGELFRVSYQGVEAIYQNQQPAPATSSERIGLVFKNHIAFLDASLTAIQYLSGSERLNAWVSSFEDR